MNQVERLVERLESTRNGDRFDELVAELLPGEESARRAAAELVSRLPGSGWGRISLIRRCRQCGVREAVPQIRAVFEETGTNLRTARVASLWALNDLLDGAERAEFLIHALDDRDHEVGTSAAIRVGFSEDSGLVGPLLGWLEGRLARPRSKAQARRTGEIIATCLRLGSAEQANRLRAIAAAVKLTELEQMALDGRYRGQIASRDYPILSWPA